MSVRARGFLSRGGALITLYPVDKLQGSTVSLISLQAPKQAKKAYGKGKKAAKKKRWEEAQAAFEEAVRLYPKYAEAWNGLGEIHLAGKRLAVARLAFRRASELDPKFLPPVLHLAMLDTNLQAWDKVLETTGYAIRMNAFEFPVAYYLQAVAQYNLKRLPEAEASLIEAVNLDQQHSLPQAVHLLGMTMAQQGKFDEATERLEEYLKLAPKAANTAEVRQVLARIAELAQSGAGPQGQQFARAGGR
ncbi:MAG: tetratricopeptide repeat protein [bacterium]|nr:tetratricopeptide repeat protein [bacterium]